MWKPSPCLPARALKAALVAALALALAAGCWGCVPQGAAVGDTQSVAASPEHDSVQGARIAVGIVQASGASDAAADASAVLRGLQAAGMAGLYAAPAALDTQRAAMDAVQGFIDRRVHLVIIDGLDMEGADGEAWTSALQGAREAGIAVALLDPGAALPDATLYAATLAVSDAAGAQPVADAVDAIVRDEPHARAIDVDCSAAANARLNGYS